MPLILPDTNMSHYPPHVLKKYLEAVERDKAAGYESDEAVLSDDGSSDNIDIDMDDEPIQAPIITAEVVAAKMQKMYIDNNNIQSDDSGFSSEDEFIDDGLRHELNIRRELILGRPPPELEGWKLEKVLDYHLAYIKQLNDANTELQELLNQGRSGSGVLTSGEKLNIHGDNSEDAEAEVTEVKRLLVRGMVVLSQALFRKEKQIKRIVEVQGIQLTAPQ